MPDEGDTEQRLPRDLGDGLVLRRATPDDVDAVARFNADIHRGPDQPPNEGTAAWARDLMSGAHPTCRAEHFTVVEDTRANRIASSLCLIPQTWAYGGVPFGVGRPELVGTHPEYRRRGLVRAQFEEIHTWSAARGDLVQAITGIPWYYRQFGYELGGIPLGGRMGYAPQQVPKLPDGAREPFRVRPATDADLPFLAEVYALRAERDPVVCVRDEAAWRYELDGRSPASDTHAVVAVIETAEGKPAGYIVHKARLEGAGIWAGEYELARGVSWAAATPTVIRYLVAQGEEYAALASGPFGAFAFWIGGDHPIYEVAAAQFPEVIEQYAWYLRVPDLAAFLRLVAPALERRLKGSLVEGYTGELRLNCFRDGVRLEWERGRLFASEPWEPVMRGESAAFPPHTFLQLLFGYRTLDELRHAFAECRVRGDEARLLLGALFPKRLSHVWPLS